MRVLLVEDHLQLAESVAQALKSTGLTVDVLHDGVAADLALSSEEYAMAILDVGLPRMDGFEVLARLRARGKNLPVLMLTARSDVKDRVHGLNLGADDYLAKPFELTELEARVKALLRRSVLGGERQQTLRRAGLRSGHPALHPRRRIADPDLPRTGGARSPDRPSRSGDEQRATGLPRCSVWTKKPAPTPSKSTSTACARNSTANRSPS